MSKTKQHRPALNEFLFWFHFFGFNVVFLLCGLVFPLPVVVLIFVAYQVHLIVFDGCFVTRIQHYYGAVPKDKGYYQIMFKRFFKLELSQDQAYKIASFVELSVLVIAMAASWLRSS